MATRDSNSAAHSFLCIQASTAATTPTTKNSSMDEDRSIEFTRQWVNTFLTAGKDLDPPTAAENGWSSFGAFLASPATTWAGFSTNAASATTQSTTAHPTTPGEFAATNVQTTTTPTTTGFGFTGIWTGTMGGFQGSSGSQLSATDFRFGATTTQAVPSVAAATDTLGFKFGGCGTTRGQAQTSDSPMFEQRQRLLKAILCDTKVGDENALTKLKLDHEFEPGITILVLILYYFCIDLYPTDPSHPRLIAMDPKRSGFTSALLSNLRRHGYMVFSSFDWSHLESVVGPANVRGNAGNILSLLLMNVVLDRWTMPGAVEYLSLEEKGFIQWIEDVIRVILEQPTLTQETKSKFVNEFHTAGRTDIINPLGMISKHENSYISLARLLISHGADINATEDGSPSPLMHACLSHHVELVLEMILSQANLLTIELTQVYRQDLVNHSILSAFTTKFGFGAPTTQAAPSVTAATSTLGFIFKYGGFGTVDKKKIDVNTTDSFRGVRCSTPIKLLKCIINRLSQWQEKEKRQLALNSALQPNDVEIRQWLREQLTSLPNLLFAATIQHSMHPLTSPHTGWELTHQPKSDHAARHRDYLRRWIHQLQTSPATINLIEIYTNRGHRSSTFLVDSFDIFLEAEFAPSVPQLLNLLDESHLSFIDSLILFGERATHDFLPNVFQSIPPLLDYDKFIGDHGAQKQDFVLQLMDVLIQRLSHIIQVYQSETWKNNQDYLRQLRLSYGYDSTDMTHDHELSTILSRSLVYINDGVPETLFSLAGEIGKHSSVDVFLALWTKTLPRLEHFRLKEFSYRCEMMHELIFHTLIRLHDDQSFQRFQSFINHPFFQHTDLFQPFQMNQASSDCQGLTIVEVAKKSSVSVGECTGWMDSNSIDYRQTIADYILRLESDWTTIHWPMIRTNLEQYLIPDIAGMVLDMLQVSSLRPAPVPVSHESASSASLLSTTGAIDITPYPPTLFSNFGFGTFTSFQSSPDTTTYTNPTFSTPTTTDGSIGIAFTNTNAPLMTPAVGELSFGAAATAPSIGSPSTTSGFSFGGVPTNTDVHAPPVATASGFTFGVTPASTDSSSVQPITHGFTFGSSGVASGFSFGASSAITDTTPKN